MPNQFVRGQGLGPTPAKRLHMYNMEHTIPVCMTPHADLRGRPGPMAWE